MYQNLISKTFNFEKVELLLFLLCLFVILIPIPGWLFLRNEIMPLFDVF